MIDQKDLKDNPYPQLKDKDRVRNFQLKLYCKAKQEKEFRFYVLYDKLTIPYIMREAWKKVKSNQGVNGIDEMKISDVVTYGEEKYLEEIRQELLNKTYKPSPVLRVYIPKANGKLRPLGIPTVKDRIVQMCCKLIIEPIFEADFETCSYGFRPLKSAKQAIVEIKEYLDTGYTNVYDADLSGYFDTIPHDKLMIVLSKRIADKHILKLIKSWLKTPASEDGKLTKSNLGTPQGGVISPLLANIYLNILDKAVNRKNGIFSKHNIKIIRYADDFILMGRKIPEQCLDYMNAILERMELEVNEDKTHLLYAIATPFDFLGFTFRYNKDMYGRKLKYQVIEARKKSCQNIREAVRDYLMKNKHLNRDELAKGLNLILKGWVNYFTIQGVSKTKKQKRQLRFYLMNKLYRYYRRKSQRKCKLYRRDAYKVLTIRHGLVDLMKYKYV